MTLHAPPTDTLVDRIKLPMTFDAEKMLAEVQALNLADFVYYNALPLRSPAHLVDPSLPIPPPADDYADGTWTDWLDTKELDACPYIRTIIDYFQEHTQVNLVRLLRLEPKGEVSEHTDPTLGLQIERSMIRLTIPIQRDPSVEFFLNDVPVPLQPGECWYLRLTDRHRIINHSSIERLNLTIDMIPNDWVTSLILDSQEA